MKPVIAIIGGLGEMGRWFSRFFHEQGFEVLIGEPGLQPTCAEVAAQADVVVISVPLHLTEAVIAELAPHLRPEALLTDLTSLKVGPMEAMLRHFSGAVVGTHPIPQKYYLHHTAFGTWDGPGWQERLRYLDDDESTRLAYN